ncbi:3'-5' exonuclease [Haloechinothrix sp. YIM 98757]|uniref:3'-5' exonuclease n=1 Tax=Haloechinothrix aidingensis TaxID=2752311 RepID=A0A838AAP8_9PSEU|nr:3'-5' exonuclease [Haloechinothrix aidingensis]MBA0126314.1 3'-5' exonuclease [Haloechinothrix aidingensis]
MSNEASTERPVIVVDTETTGLDRARHVPIEVAWVDLATGQENAWIPWHTRQDISRAQPEALEINGYYQRLADAPTDHAALIAAKDLHERLGGAVLAGASPAFDADMLRILFNRTGCTPLEPWHHRLADLAAYAAGTLGIPISELPSMSRVCGLLGVQNDAPHTALGDARATAACLRAIAALPAPASAVRDE